MILAVSHYSYQVNRAGGELYLQQLLEALALKQPVSAHFTDSGYDEVRGGVQIKRTAELLPADCYVTQFANADRVIDYAHAHHRPVVLVIHNDNALNLPTLQRLTPRDMVLFNTAWIRAKLPTRAKSLVLHPPIRSFTRQQVGEYITTINPTIAKGASVFYNMTTKFPAKQFMAVKGGYYHKQQKLYPFHNVTLHEQTDDMQEIYNQSRIVLQMSDYESFGMVAREAAVQGIPVIATPTPGLIENLGADYPYFAKFNDFDTVQRYIKALDDPATYQLASKDITTRSQRIDQAKELKQAVEAICSL